MTDYAIRPVQGDDIPFIYSSWLRSYRNDSLVGSSVKKSIFFDNYQRVLDQILSKNTTKTFVVCKPDQPSVIFGYAVTEPSTATLHYVFVKEAFRGFGLTKALLAEAFPTQSVSAVSITHKTKTAARFCAKFTYNPFSLYQLPPKET